MSIYTAGHQLMQGGGLLLNLAATASNSAALPTGTTGVYLTATIPGFIEIGGAATASANTGLYLAASATSWFPAAAGNAISGVRSGGADGALYIKPTCD